MTWPAQRAIDAIRRQAFIAGALTVNPDLDDQQLQEMADAYLRHSREER